MAIFRTYSLYMGRSESWDENEWDWHVHVWDVQKGYFQLKNVEIYFQMYMP